jgi:hypothetical protein
MSVPTTKELKDQITMSIDSTIAWRKQKAEQFSEDAERNRKAVDALFDLYRFFSTEPDIDFLKTYQNFLLWASENGNDDSIYRLTEIENEMIKSFGFQYQGTIEDFLERWLNAIRDEFKNFDEHKKN